LDEDTTAEQDVPRIVRVSRDIGAGPARIFELIAWRPAEPGKQPPGHLWRWELEPSGPAGTRVTHTYDWTRLTDQSRVERARATTAGKLRASLDRLAALAEQG
jgi:hypothetical protein